MFSPPRLPMLRSQREDLLLTLMISPWSMRESMLLLLSLRSVPRTLTRSLVNGSPRLLILELRLLPPRMRDLLDQLGEGGRSIHALDKQRRMLEQEKEELQGALEEAEATPEMEENRVLRSQLELANVRQEIDRRVA